MVLRLRVDPVLYPMTCMPRVCAIVFLGYLCHERLVYDCQMVMSSPVVAALSGLLVAAAQLLSHMLDSKYRVRSASAECSSKFQSLGYTISHL